MTETTSSPPRFPIRVAAGRAGLKAHVIRAWERRYQALTPARTGGGHRTYTETDVERLRLLRRVTGAGHPISQVAGYSDQELLELLASYEVTQAPSEFPAPAGGRQPPNVGDCLEAVRALDSEGLLFELERALVDLGPARALQEVAVPLVEQVDRELRKNRLRLMHVRAAEVVVRSFCDHLIRHHHPPKSAAVLVAAVPAGHLCDVGACLMSAVAALAGWRVTCLGIGLPAEEIVAAAHQTRARAVGLGLPREIDGRLAAETARMRRHLDPAAVMLAAGPALSPAGGLPELEGLTPIRDPQHLAKVLARLEEDATDVADAGG